MTKAIFPIIIEAGMGFVVIFLRMPISKIIKGDINIPIVFDWSIIGLIMSSGLFINGPYKAIVNKEKINNDAKEKYILSLLVFNFESTVRIKIGKKIMGINFVKNDKTKNVKDIKLFFMPLFL
jgi:ABC-type sulfate transport system permease component